MEDSDDNGSDNEQPSRNLRYFPFFQYFVLGSLFSCAEISHIVRFFPVKPSNETKNAFFENAADMVHGMDTWVLVTILIGKYIY